MENCALDEDGAPLKLKFLLPAAAAAAEVGTLQAAVAASAELPTAAVAGMEAAIAAAMEEAVLVRSRCSRLSSVAGAMAARVAAVMAWMGLDEVERSTCTTVLLRKICMI